MAVKGFKSGGTSAGASMSRHSPCVKSLGERSRSCPFDNQELPFSRDGTNLKCPFSPLKRKGSVPVPGYWLLLLQEAGKAAGPWDCRDVPLERKAKPTRKKFYFYTPIISLALTDTGFAVAFSFSVINKQLPWEPC